MCEGNDDRYQRCLVIVVENSDRYQTFTIVVSKPLIDLQETMEGQERGHRYERCWGGINGAARVPVFEASRS